MSENTAYLDIKIEIDGQPNQYMEFTNVPMTRVHAAIAILNGDTDFGLMAGDTTHIKRAEAWVNPLKEFMPKEALAAERERQDKQFIETFGSKPRHEDFTSRELFGNQIGEDRNGRTIKECLECGALVTKHGKHTSWHNKLLP